MSDSENEGEDRYQDESAGPSGMNRGNTEPAPEYSSKCLSL